MKPECHPVTLSLPRLSDDAVVEIHEFLYDFLHVFETRYGNQIHRYHEKHSCDEIIRYGPRNPPDDPPF